MGRTASTENATLCGDRACRGVECAKCRRECDWVCARATLCGDRACRVRETQARVPLGLCTRTLCGDRACRVCEMQARVRLGLHARATLCGDRSRRARATQARVRLGLWRAQPSAEIVRVECVKRRRECDWVSARATLCGDRACRVREMQARVRLGLCGRNDNLLRRSCVSSARNAGERAIGSVYAQPSAEIVRVECAKCRRECDWVCARATLCGDRACGVREMLARVRLGLCARNPLRRSCVWSVRNPEHRLLI